MSFFKKMKSFFRRFLPGNSQKLLDSFPATTEFEVVRYKGGKNANELYDNRQSEPYWVQIVDEEGASEGQRVDGG